MKTKLSKRKKAVIFISVSLSVILALAIWIAWGNIALEINTLKPICDILDTNIEIAALSLCHILTSLGEVIGLDEVFDLNLKETFEKQTKRC